MVSRHVEVIYCDDIRYEINGKVSYIGVYSADLFVTTFPTILPRLCLDIKAVTPVSEPFRAMTVRIFKDDEKLQEITSDEKALSAAYEEVSSLASEGIGEKMQVAQTRMVFSPMKFEGPCTLRVVLQTENGELKGMSLRVSQEATLEESSDKEGEK